MSGLILGALVALGMAQQTDTVLPLGNAERLELTISAGSITVTGWDRDEIRVQAEHSSRTRVEVRRSHDGRLVMLEAVARRGLANIVDFTLSVPRTLGVELEGLHADISTEGMAGPVEAETLQGDVTVVGARGPVSAHSMTGRVHIEDAEGRIEVETAAEDIRLVNVAGEIFAESAGGDILLEGVRATSVDAGTVGGRIHYDGPFRPGGTYFFGSHGGSVTLVVPEGTNARFHLASVYGTVVNALSGVAERSEGGQRHTIEVGDGGALVEVETYGGRIALVRPGAEGARPGSGPG